MKKAERVTSLEPAESGQGDFMAQVHVRLLVPLADPDESIARELHGYYLNLGIRSAPHRVELVVAQAIDDDGVIDWNDTEWNLVDISTLSATIRSRIKPVTSEGVWYASGRIFYSDSDDEATSGHTPADGPDEVRPQ
jgi:hypothetical protein